MPDGWRGLVAGLPPTGRCPGCQRRIGPPAGTVEAVAGVMFPLLAVAGGGPIEAAAFWWVAALLVSRRAGRKDTIPHGPFMLAGALAAVVLVE